MKNLAPKIMRKRLLVEGFYDIKVNQTTIKTAVNHIGYGTLYGTDLMSLGGGIKTKGVQHEMLFYRPSKFLRAFYLPSSKDDIALIIDYLRLS